VSDFETPPPLQPGDDGYIPIMDDLAPFKVMRHYDRSVQPISLRQWGILHDREAYRVLANDYLDEGNIWISTVWLGLDHNWEGGAPLIFETMSFVHMTPDQLDERRRVWREMNLRERDFPWNDLDCERYSTEEEARDGHRQMVDSLRMRVEILTEHPEEM
jgi:hypothetical protein